MLPLYASGWRNSSHNELGILCSQRRSLKGIGRRHFRGSNEREDSTEFQQQPENHRILREALGAAPSDCNEKGDNIRTFNGRLAVLFDGQLRAHVLSRRDLLKQGLTERQRLLRDLFLHYVRFEQHRQYQLVHGRCRVGGHRGERNQQAPR